MAQFSPEDEWKYARALLAGRTFEPGQGMPNPEAEAPINDNPGISRGLPLPNQPQGGWNPGWPHRAMTNPRELSGMRDDGGNPVTLGKKELFREILSGALYGIGKGMSAASRSTPDAAPTAAFGAALLAPYDRADEHRKLSFQESLADQREVYAQAALERAEASQRMAAQREQENELVDTLDANGHPIQVRRRDLPNFITGLITAKARESTADTAKKKARYVYTPEGVIDTEAPDEGARFVKNTDRYIKLTDSIVTSLGLPKELIGQSFRATELNALKPKGNTARIVTTKDGVLKYDMVTGEKTKIGDIPPPRPVGSMVPQIDPFTNIFRGYFNPTTGRIVGQPEIFQGSGRSLAVGDKDKIVTLDDLREDLDFIEGMWERHAGTMGPVSGKFTKFVQKMPDSIAELFPDRNNPEVSELFRVIRGMKAQVRLTYTGKQANEMEYKNLDRLVPNEDLNSANFKGSLKAFREELERTIAKRKTSKSIGDSPSRTINGKSVRKGKSVKEMTTEELWDALGKAK